MAKVVLKNVEKSFDNHPIVRDFNLEINDEEFCVLVGPSGCGKTTTLRMIAGLEEITSGQIFIDDVLINEVPPKDRDIAFVFQNYALYPHMSVYENMAFGLRLRSYPKDEIDRRVKEAAGILNIEHLLDRFPRQLSGGQRQRVAVGRAIVRKPKVFLFDEPLSNLDAKLRVVMRSELKKLHARLKATMIYVTHDQVEAMTMGDKICVMKDGIIQQVSSPLELYEKPINKFVAGFIGSPPMNFWEMLITEKSGNLFAVSGGAELKIPARISPLLLPYNGQKVIFGVRPEDIYDKLFYRLGPIDGNVLTATVDIIEPLGSEIYLHLRVAKDVLVAKVDAHNTARENQLIEVVINMDKVHFFDPKTEQAIV